MRKRFADEFKSKDRFRFSTNLGENWQSVFGHSPWNGPLADDRVFVGIRVALALLMVGVVAWDLTFEAQIDAVKYFPVFLTNWTLLAVTGYTVLAAFATGAAVSSRGTNNNADDDPIARARAEAARAGANAVPWYVRACWLMHSVALPASLMVVALFWSLVYAPGKTKVHALTVFLHGINGVVMLVDLFVAQTPYFLAHGVYMWIYGAAYTLFSYIYYAGGGETCGVTNGVAWCHKYIYTALDWGKPGRTGLLTAGTLLVAIPLTILFCWLLVQLRKHLTGSPDGADGRYRNSRLARLDSLGHTLLSLPLHGVTGLAVAGAPSPVPPSRGPAGPPGPPGDMVDVDLEANSGSGAAVSASDIVPGIASEEGIGFHAAQAAQASRGIESRDSFRVQKAHLAKEGARREAEATGKEGRRFAGARDSYRINKAHLAKMAERRGASWEIRRQADAQAKDEEMRRGGV